ncbi:TetR/AcrR family transcriptional regulator [Jiangella alkaliphila]|uniref:DNA-binding transcriptional regulator, AcrR family n=1 Tax=Jiangella alkaliphila TaxID=419479 RepID=A0A1H2JTP4_9ACTN|nr:TetR/AcrR family transcriptional regulator [Jiangella alkaliphila]SDU59780.1 DNA-binding transcriptional regulator, AcrR family [Jiangella alkaliphila]
MTTAESTDTRGRIVRAAAELLERGGREAVSTRAVSAAAGVQAPTLYRLFGDMDGLLDAVAGYGFEQYLRDKREQGETDDPVADLRRGWDHHIEFGLTRPAFYVLMYGNGRPAGASAAGREAAGILRRLIGRVAAAGRLTMSVERAAQFAHATGVGIVLTLIATPEAERDRSVADLARDAVLRTLVTDAAPSSPGEGLPPLAGRAVALRETLRETLRADDDGPLTAAERALLEQWLDRLADGR